MIGTIISHYKILEKLGEGGMGVVYKAEDTKLDRQVALKFLPPHLAASEQDKARFVQEAKAASALNHPNVCTIYAIEEHDGQMFIAMELVEGQTLREKRGTIYYKQAIDIGIQIADGLAAAHEKGIVHRDIKPENIMLRKDGIAQIMDFGLAKLRASGSKITRLTKEGSTVGTAGYMSPEQVQGQDSDHRSDIFSYGVVLYELLTGQLPFKGVHDTALAYEIVNVDPPPMSAVKPEIDPNLDAIVLECLEKDPRERNQSIAQVSLDLKRYRRESSKQKMSRITAARPVVQAGGMQQPTSSESQHAAAAMNHPSSARLSWLPWSVAVLFALALAALALIHFREAPPVTPSINAVLLPPPAYNYDASIGGHMTLSPDGTMLAFVAVDSGGKSSLWVRPLGSSTARQLPETYGASFPFWSPDNMTIGFFVPGKLKKISISGTPAVVICDAQSGRGGDWNKDGVIIFAPSFDLVSIFRVSAGGGTPVAVTHLDSSRNESNHRWPHFLPDGNHFIYTTQAKIRSADYVGSIYLAALDTSVNRQLVRVSSNAQYADGRLLYVRQSAVVAQPFDLSSLELSGDASPVAEKVEFSTDKSRGSFSIAENGFFAYQPAGNNPRRLWMVNRAGVKLKDVGDRTLYNSAQLSRDGTKVVFDSQEGAGVGDIWLCDLVRDLTTRFTFDAASEWQPVWSPDGSRIVYATDKTGSGDLFIKNANGTESAEVLLKDVPPKTAMDWSPDGKFVLYYLFSPTSKEDLWIMPMDSAKTPSPFLQTEFTEWNARFAPDGRWVVYQSDESGTSEIYVRPFPTGNGKWQISTSGGEAPMWSRDGKEIFYHQPGGATMAVEISGAGAALVVGAAKKVFDIPRSVVLDATADGQQFLTAVMIGAQSSPPVTLITQWDRDLKKK